MTIETATPEAQYEVRRRSVVAADLTQRFANRADPITAGQAADVDTALTALLAALAAAGFSPAIPATSKTIASGVKVPVGTVTGTGTFGTPTIVGGVITGIVLSAS